MSPSLHPGSFAVVLVSGSIAASNSAGLVSVLRERLGQPVVAVLTARARDFVAIETIRYAGGAAAVVTDGAVPLFDQPDHIWLATHMSGLLVYPASANFIARIGTALAADTASLVFLAGHLKRRMIVPSMNRLMWSNPMLQGHIACLQDHGVRVASTPDGMAPDVNSVVDEFCNFMGASDETA